MSDLKRKSLRLKGHDYSGAGAYFVTICTQGRECLFGEIAGGQVRLNEWGTIVESEWLKTSSIRPNVELDKYVVMPNHFHAIVYMRERRGVLQYAPTVRSFHSPSQTIGAITRGFKSVVTKHINELRRTPGIAIWQRNYYERVIRNEMELNQTRQYILDNPKNWETDPENVYKVVMV